MNCSGMLLIYLAGREPLFYQTINWLLANLYGN